MTKFYKIYPNVYLPFLIIAIIAFYVLVFLKKSEFVLGISLLVFITALGVFLILFFILGKVKIDNEGITTGKKFFFDYSKSLKWNQIKLIKYKPSIFLKSVRIYPFGSKWAQLSASITLSNLIKNYPELLREIIMNTYDEAKIDPEVVNLAGLTMDDLKNRRSNILIKVIE